MDKKTIGSFLSVLRKANGYTQKQLAEKLNVSDKTLSKWERDKSSPDLSVIPVLAEIFGVTCDEILRGERKNFETASGENSRRDNSVVKSHILSGAYEKKQYIIIFLIIAIISFISMPFICVIYSSSLFSNMPIIPILFFSFIIVLVLIFDVLGKKIKIAKLLYVISAILFLPTVVQLILMLISVTFKPQSISIFYIGFQIFIDLFQISLFIFLVCKIFKIKKMKDFNLKFFIITLVLSNIYKIILFSQNSYKVNFFLEITSSCLFLISVIGLMLADKDADKMLKHEFGIIDEITNDEHIYEQYDPQI